MIYISGMMSLYLITTDKLSLKDSIWMAHPTSGCTLLKLPLKSMLRNLYTIEVYYWYTILWNPCLKIQLTESGMWLSGRAVVLHVWGPGYFSGTSCSLEHWAWLLSISSMPPFPQKITVTEFFININFQPLIKMEFSLVNSRTL